MKISRHSIFMSALILLSVLLSASITPAYIQAAQPPSKLYAKYAALIDADSGRVLFEKDGYTPAANASTTKILTCLIALELGHPDDIVTVSAYASSMPDVQLNIIKGEQYRLNDLLYSLMLQSHNDSAVAIAEHIASVYLDTGTQHTDTASRPRDESIALVNVFAQYMNRRAGDFGCVSTNFITPNGLDAANESGFHSTTAVDLAHIMAKCIQNKEFISITQSQNHSFHTVDGHTLRSVHNTNAFLNMMDGVLSGKTGFTGNAGYCYVCALESDGRRFISVVLACGWPGNKTYKWKDTRSILEFAKSTYYRKEIFTPVYNYQNVNVTDGIEKYVSTYIPDSVNILIGENDIVNVTYSLPSSIEAPVENNQIVGSVSLYINDNLYTQLPIYSGSKSDLITFNYCLRQTIKAFLFG